MIPLVFCFVLVAAAPAQQTLLAADFDTGTDGFTYADDLFRGTSQPAYAAGDQVAAGGYRGGALRVVLGGRDNAVVRGMSGGFSSSFAVPDLGTSEVVLELRFRIEQTPDYPADGFSEALAAVDGALHGQRPFDSLGTVVGDGTGGSTRTSYWKLIRLPLGRLTRGTHRLSLGGFNNRKTAANQTTTVYLDEVRVTVEDPVDPREGARAVVALTSFQAFKDNIRTLASFGDRTQGSQSYRNADQWLTQQLTAAGYQVQRHQYSYGGQARDQIHVTKIGSLYPDRMFLVTAHFDGRGGGGAADDDGSGCSLVLEAARAFATPGIDTGMSIRFVFWNNEETGLNGSAAYVSSRSAMQGQEVPAGSGRFPEPTWLGVLQHDMILFDHGLPPQNQQIPAADMDIEYQSAAVLAQPALALARELAAGSRVYALKYPAEIGPNMRNTDSWSFRDATAAVSLRENQRVAEIGRGANPNWHQPSDVFATYSDADFALGYDIARTTIGTIAELAGTTDRRATFRPFGQGCAGTAGVPSLQAGSGQLPWLGRNFTMTHGALPGSGILVGLLGFSDRTWGSRSLPYDLQALNMPGCRLFVSPDFLFYLAISGGSAPWTLPLPSTPALVGLPFFVQSVVSDPGANPGGMVVSNAARGVLGRR